MNASTGIAALADAIATVTNALSSVAATVIANPIMTIGIAGSVIATGVGLFKSLTGQRKQRGGRP